MSYVWAVINLPANNLASWFLNRFFVKVFTSTFNNSKAFRIKAGSTHKMAHGRGFTPYDEVSVNLFLDHKSVDAGYLGTFWPSISC
jgi:hypothetical protein